MAEITGTRCSGLGPEENLTRQLRAELGIGAMRAIGDGAMAMEAVGRPVSNTRGLELADVDQLLHQHEARSYQEGYNRGSDDMFARLREQHQVEIGQYVGGAFSIVESEVLAAVVGAAAKARDARGSTKAAIVDAVVEEVKRQAKGLDEMARRARTGELFS